MCGILAGQRKHRTKLEHDIGCSSGLREQACMYWNPPLYLGTQQWAQGDLQSA